VGSAEKGGSVLGDREYRAARNIFEYVVVLDFVLGRRIELANSLEDALDDVGSGTGLKSTLMVVVTPVNKPLVLYSYYWQWLKKNGGEKANRYCVQ
jgi:hypothetical protein